MEFIRIEITEELETIRRRSLTLDGVASPYLAHPAPDRMRREWIQGKPHWTFVEAEYLSKAFAEARDQVERFQAMEPRTRPTCHQIRGLARDTRRRTSAS